MIARVEYTNDDGRTEVVFVTRGTPIFVPGFRLASYNSRLGKIAAIPAGETYDPDDVVVESSTKLFPKKDRDGWDSPDTEIHLDGAGKFTVASLRALLAPQITPREEDPFTALDGQKCCARTSRRGKCGGKLRRADGDCFSPHKWRGARNNRRMSNGEQV